MDRSPWSPGAVARCALLATVATALAPLAHAQVPGPNVNVIAGSTLPNGDPYLQRQNEPSGSVSTRNPLHLLAGGNDYRTVDIPGIEDGEEAKGDAWLGLYKSTDGGSTWKTSLVPGFPQDQSPEGLASPLKGYGAGADAIVRAGTNGLFYYGGMAFNRGNNGTGVVFVARYIDNNNAPGGDPFKYLGTAVVDKGTAGRFIDKPALVVDAPRPGAKTCSILPPGDKKPQLVPAGDVYFAYVVFTGSAAVPHANLMVTRSSDCGVTWAKAVKVSEGTRTPQGVSLAIDPRNGNVHVAWREITGTPTTAKMHFAKSTDRGGKFSNPQEVASFMQFDQGAALASSGLTSFRTNAYPAMTIDHTGRTYLAWTRRPQADAPGRIVMTTSPDGVKWTTPLPIENARVVCTLRYPVCDPRDPQQGMIVPANGTPASHQVMPHITATGGKITVIYYDFSEDKSGVIESYVVDRAGRTRHTVDVRVLQADPGAIPVFQPSVRVSQYLVGSRKGGQLEQLQYNVPNLPLYSGGDKAFIGDYIEVAGQPFIQDATGKWIHNAAPGGPSMLYAFWTDNRDVRPPADRNWKNYTPVFIKDLTTGQITQCVPGQTGMRNANIYSARITQGLLVGSPSNSKKLGTIQRSFVVFAQNNTGETRRYRMTVLNQPPNGFASFLQQFPPPAQSLVLTILDVTLAPRSSASRTVYVTSSDPNAKVNVDVTEVELPPGGSTTPPPVKAGGLHGVIVLNPDVTNPDVTNPDVTNPDVTNEVFNPDVTNPDVTNPDVTNPDVTNPDVTNPDVTNVVVANPDVTNPDVTNPDVTNPDVTNPDVTNANIDGDVIRNGTLTDVTWSVTNNGNTDGSFAIKQFLAKNAPPGIKKQLIIHKVYKTLVPTYTSAGNIDDCNQKTQAQNVLVVNVADLDTAVQTPDVTNPDVTNPDVTNATLALARGETAKITLRVVTEDDTATPTVRKTVTLSSGQTRIVEVPAAFDPAQDAAPIVQAQAVDTADVAAGVTTPPVTIPLVISTTTLPDGVATKPYVSQLAATGGEPGPRTWSLVASPIVMPGQPPPPVRPLPPGLLLDPATGVIYGTPSTFGSYTFDVQVMDSASHKNSREFTLVIEAAPPAVITNEDVPVAAPMTAFGNQSSVVTFSVVTPPSHGTLIGAMPMVSYGPAPNYNGSADGPDLFVFRASYGTFSATGTVLLDVRPINDAPSAAPQTLSVNENVAKPITLTGTDVETSNANLTFAIVTPPQHGTLSGVAPNVTYTPNARYNGPDSFAFTVTDRGDPDNCASTGAPHCTGALTTAPATVALTVLPVNDSPVATPQSVETFEDRFTHIVPAGTDTETAAADLTFAVVTGPAHGTLSIDGHVATYTPHTNYNGPDSFTFTVTDRGDPDGCSGPVCAPALTSAPASVTILVKPVNDAPTFTSAATVEGTEDAGPQTVDWASQISAGAPDEAGQLLQFVATSNSNPALFTTPPTANAITGKLSWTAAPEAYGTAVIRFLLKDNGGTADGGSDTSIAHNVEITVLPVNDAPSFTKGPDQTVANTGGAQTIQVWATNITAGPLNESAQIVSFVVSASDPSLFSTQPAIDSSGTLTYTPSSATSGVATITVTARDDGGTANGGVDSSAAQTFTITVNGTEEAPVISPGDLVISEFRVYGPGGGTDQYVEIFNNTDDDIQVTSPSSNGFGLVEEGYGQLCYIPNGTVIPARGHYLCTQWYIFNGGNTTSVDDYAGIGDRRQGINAWGLHDGHQAQVNHGFALFTSTNAAEWTMATRLDAVGSVSSPDLYRSGTGLPSAFISNTEHAWVRRQSGFAVQNTGDNAADFLVVSTNTSYGGSIPAYLGAPGPETNTPGDTLSPRYGNVPGNPGLATSLLDPAVSAHAEPNQKRLNTDLWVRRRVTNNTGAPITRLRFRVTDIATLGSPGSHAVNEAELALMDAATEVVTTSSGPVTVIGATLEQPPMQFLGGGINSSLTVALPSALAPGASIDIQFKYYVYSSGDYRVSFDVPFEPPVNQRPVASDTDYTSWEDTPVIVTLDVTDPDGDLLTYSLVQTPLHGALTASPTGNPLQLQYWPGVNFSGIDSFTFKVNDKHVDSNVATIKITIDPVNDAPTFTPGANQSATDAAGAQTVVNWATNISAGAADEAGQLLDFIVSNDNHALFAVQPAVSPTGTLTYTPAPNANGTANVTVALHDDGGTANGGADTSLTRFFQITIVAANAPPDAVDDSPIVNEDSFIDVDVLANDTDPDSDTLTITSATTPAHGTAVINGSKIRYTPNANYFGFDRFNYTISDGQGGTDTALVTVSIDETNDAPVAVDDDDIAAAAIPRNINVVGNDTDAEQANGAALITDESLTPGVGSNVGFVNELALLGSTGNLYASGSRGIAIYTTATDGLVGTIDLASQDLVAASFHRTDAARDMVYFRHGANVITAIDGRPSSPTYNQLIGRLQIGSSIQAFAIDESRGLMYVSGNTAVLEAPFEARISIVDVRRDQPTFMTVIDEIAFFGAPGAPGTIRGIAVDEVNDRVYAAADGGLLRIDHASSTDRTASTIATNGLLDLLLFNGRVYAYGGGGNIAYYDPSTSFLRSIPISNFAFGFVPGKRFVAHAGSGRLFLRSSGGVGTSGKVLVIDTATGTWTSPTGNPLIEEVTLVGRDGTSDIVVDQTRNLVITTSVADNQVTMINANAAAGTINATVQLRELAIGADIVLNETSGRLYATNFGILQRATVSPWVVFAPTQVGAESGFAAALAGPPGTPNRYRFFLGHTAQGSGVRQYPLFDNDDLPTPATLAHTLGRIVFIAANTQTNRLYALNGSANAAGTASTPGSVAVIDAATGNALATLDVGHAPFGIAVNETSNKIYVANGPAVNGLQGGLSIVDGAMHQVTHVTMPGTFAFNTSFGRHFATLCVGPSCGTVDKFYVQANEPSGETTVAVYNATTGTVARLGPTVGIDEVDIIRTSAVRNRVFIGNDTDDSAHDVVVFDGATDTKVATLRGVSSPSEAIGTQSYLAVDDARGRIYSADFNAHRLFILDATVETGCTASNTAPTPACYPILASISTGFGPTSVAFDSVANRIYVGSTIDKRLTVIDGATMKVVSTVQLPMQPTGLVIDNSSADITYIFATSSFAEPGAMLISDEHRGSGLSVAAGSLTTPAHGTVTLAADGTVEYTSSPGFTGTDTFRYRVTDGVSVSANEATVSVGVIGLLTVTTTSLPTAVAGQPYTATFTAAGGVPPYVWTLIGGIPGGLRFDSSTGVLSGTPTQSGTFELSIGVADSGSPQQFTGADFMLLVEPFVVATTGLPTATLNQAYSTQLFAGGSEAAPFTWTLEPGSTLPPGLNLSPSGLLNGTPTQTTCNSASFTVRVTDSSSPPRTATRQLTMFFSSVIRITSTSFDVATFENFTRTVFTTCGSGTRSWSLVGSAPRGVTFDNGLFTTPANLALGISSGAKVTGAFPLSVQVSDSSGSDTKTVTLNIHGVDQAPFSGGGAALTVSGSTRVAQTFTVGATGMLTAIRYQTLTCSTPNAANPLTIKIARVNGTTGAPDDSQVLATMTATITGSNQIVPLPSPLFFAVESRLAVVASSTGTCSIANPNAANSYDGGNAFVDTGAGWQPPTGGDIAVNTLMQNDALTYMDQSRSQTRSVTLNDGRVLIYGPNGTANIVTVAPVTSMISKTVTVRVDPTLTLLDSGKVLVAGGHNGAFPPVYLATAEIFDPATNTFTPTATPMSEGRAEHAATLLDNDMVLITGGLGALGGNSFGSLQSADLYNPANNAFTATNLMRVPRRRHQATKLADGRVLLTGRFGTYDTTDSAEFYDPATSTFSAAPDMLTPRASHTATLMADDTVIIAGGEGASGLVTTGELFTPGASACFTAAGQMLTPRANHTATLLPGGLNVLLAGGRRSTHFSTAANASTEQYVASNGFMAGPPMAVTRADHSAAHLGDGRVVVSGGVGANNGTGSRQAAQTIEIVSVTSVSEAPYIFDVVMPDGTVGNAYSHTLTAIGILPFTFAIVDPASLPPGLSLNGSTIEGMPTVAGTFAFMVRVEGGSGSKVSYQTLRIRISALDITTMSLPPAAVGEPYSFTLAATGIGDKEWSIATGSLPAGSPAFALNGETGEITGTPTATGFSFFMVRAIDSVGQVVIAPFSLQVNDPLAITTTTLSDGVIGNTYGGCINFTNGIAPYTWTLSGSYPRDLAFQSNNSGCFDSFFSHQLIDAGTFTFDVTVTDSSSPPQSDTRTLTLTVHAVDQQVPGETTPVLDLPAATRIAQVFEAGTSFGLSGVQLFNLSSCTPNMTISAAAYAVTGAPARPADLAAPLAVASTTVSSFGFFNGNVRFPAGVPIPRGGRFAVVITFTDGSCKASNWPVNDLYLHGDGYIDEGSGWKLTSAELGRADVAMATLTMPTGLAYLSTWHSGRLSATLSDGRVLLIAADGKADIYDPGSNTTVHTGSMSVPRSGATATVLPDDRVVVIGGSHYDSTLNQSVPTDVVEIFDPTANDDVGAFTEATGSLVTARVDHTATRLANGRILVAGGYGYQSGVSIILGTAEFYDPVGQSSSEPVPMIASRARHTATMTDGDRVLLAGGYSNGPFPAPNAEIYEGASGGFITLNGDLASFRAEHAATLLNDGRVLITGGVANYPELAFTTEIFDPSDATFSTATGLRTPRLRHTATLLPDGRVLVAGGLDDRSNGRALSSLEIVEPGSTLSETVVTSAGDLAMSRTDHGAGLIADGPNAGKTWFAGGWGDSALSARSVETIGIHASTLMITTASLPNGSANQPYDNATIDAAGGSGSGYVFSLVWGELPDGMSFSNGTISGTPTERGQWPITVKVTDDATNVAHKTFTLAVNKLTITSPDQLTNAAPYSGYSYQLEADGVAPFTWSLAYNPTLPGSVTLSSGGLLSGVTGGPGFFGFTVRVRDASGQVLLRWMWINVEPELFVTQTSEALNVAIAPWNYGYCLSASGGGGPRTWEKISGELPVGLTLDSNGCVNGNTLKTGTYTFTAQVKTEAQQAPPVTLTLHAGTTDQAAWTIDSGALWRFGQDAPADEKGMLAQVFTPAMDGYLLAVQMPVYCEGANLTLQIRSVAGGVPGANVLASGVVSANELEPFFSPYHRQLRLSAPLFLAKGTQVAAVLDSPGICWMFAQPANSVDTDYSYFYGDAYRESSGTWQALALGEPARPDVPFQAVMDEGGDLAFTPVGRNQNRDGAVTLTVGPFAGLVLFAGGDVTSGTPSYLYNPTALPISGIQPGQFGSAAMLTFPRAHHTLTTLSDGYVLAIGGLHNGDAVSAIELYDPYFNLWTTVGHLVTARFMHTATWTSGNRVVVIGGHPSWGVFSGQTEIVDYNATAHTANVFDSATMNVVRVEHRAVRLNDNRVLVTGGWGAAPQYGAEIFDPSTPFLQPTLVPMTVGRAQHTATLLACPAAVTCDYAGKVWVAGGWPTQGGTNTSTIELFDPSTSSFSPAGELGSPRSNHQAVQINTGQIVIAGGSDLLSNALSSVEAFNPDDPDPIGRGEMVVARNALAAVALANGSILLANGWGPSAATWATVEEFDPTRHLLPRAFTTVGYTASLGEGSTFSLVSGSLPPGITLNTTGTSATLTGMPTAAGIYSFAIEVTDEVGMTSLRRWSVVVIATQ